MNFSESKTPGTLIAEILMLQTMHHGGFLIVEGDSDSRFWQSRVEKAYCKIVIAGGKPNAIGVSQLLDARNDLRAIGVVDTDFDRLANRALSTWRLATTDCHDLEMTLIKSRALERVLYEVAHAEKMAAFIATQGKNLLEIVFERALPLGHLRYINEVNHYSVSFDNLTPYRYIDQSTFVLNLPQLKSDFCQRAGIPLNILENELKAAPNAPLEDLIQGHDAISILCIALRALLSNQSMSDKELASRLRLAFHDTDLANTKMHQHLLLMEDRLEIKIFPGATARSNITEK